MADAVSTTLAEATAAVVTTTVTTTVATTVATTTAAAAQAATTAAPQSCGLLGDSFAVEVQVALGVTCLVVLLLKKLKEGNERTWQEFILDGSKQIMGAGFIHVANMVLSTLMGSDGVGDPCEWYWISIMIDCTFGVFIEYALLMASGDVLWILWGQEYNEDDYKTGEYWEKDTATGQLVEPKKVHWPKYFKQLALWLCIVACMKWIVMLIMINMSGFFAMVAHVSLAVFELDTHLELIVVMVLTPMVMNAVQFYLVDNIIKKKGGAHARETRELSYTPLMEA